MSTETETAAQPVLLMLVDISGYTRFMVEHGKELRHSQMIMGELLESLIRQVDVPLRISSIEGDALFLYAVKSGDEEVWERRGANLIDRLLGLFQVFAQRLVEIGAYSVCNCEACRVVGNLKLKIIAHSGLATFTHVGDYPTLSGVDVITLHRLGKNSVTEDQYMLMTESAYSDLGAPAGVEITEGVEEVDTGSFKTHLLSRQSRSGRTRNSSGRSSPATTLRFRSSATKSHASTQTLPTTRDAAITSIPAALPLPQTAIAMTGWRAFQRM